MEHNLIESDILLFSHIKHNLTIMLLKPWALMELDNM